MPRVLRLDHVELLCSILFCEPNDLLVWTPEKKHTLSENHPLSKLVHQEKGENWQEIMATMPFKELKEVTKAMADKTRL